MKITPIILSGGSGTRLWPLSRSSSPKQFLKIFGDDSLFQKTVLRASDSNIFNKPVIVCNNEHRFTVAEEMQKIKTSPSSIILEPTGRNTAPAVAIAALDVLKNYGSEDDIILVMPSDHLIADEKAFLEAVKNSLKLAKEGYLITFGIVPNKPETGYGYIEKDVAINKNSYQVKRFVEKPALKTAKEFLASKNFFWNSGIFMFRASAYLENLNKLAAEIFVNSCKAYNNAIADLDFIRLETEAFEKCPNISIDYAVMEKAKKIALVPLDAGWNDIGSWSAISEVSERNDEQNSFVGDVITEGVKNCYINSKYGLVAAIGVENLIIINLKDAVLVANKNNAQDVKIIYEMLKKNKREECSNHPQVFRPWGSFETVDLSDRFKVKRIVVNPGASLSLQMHHHRAEHWVVVKGTAHVTCGNKKFILSEDESTYIPVGKKHRLENKGKVALELIEVQTGGYLGEDDIVRFSDIYGR